MKTCCFKTLGCKVNQYDTQVIREKFLRLGYTETGENADVCVVNTCTVTGESDRKSRYLIRRITRDNPGAKVIVTGCMAQLDHEEIAALPGVSMVVKNDDKDKIPELVTGKPMSYPEDRPSYPLKEGSYPAGITNFHSHTRAFVKVQDGCDRHCTYCRVRFARGPSRSRQLKEIIKEAEGLARAGYKEAVLTGIQIGAYGRDGQPRSSLGELIRELVKVQGLIRLRLSSIELTEISEKLINQFSVSGKLCRHLHIPLQSGDDKILKSMGRDYNASYYRERVLYLKKIIPGLTLATDVIAGFPGEGEEEFNNTLNFLKEAGFFRFHIFPYSPRPGTPAYRFAPKALPSDPSSNGFSKVYPLGLADRKAYPGGRVKPDVVRKRVKLLRKISAGLSKEYRLSQAGRTVNVLIEYERDGKTGFLTGLTEGYLRVYLSGSDDLKNQLVEAKVTGLLHDGVEAKILNHNIFNFMQL